MKVRLFSMLAACAIALAACGGGGSGGSGTTGTTAGGAGGGAPGGGGGTTAGTTVSGVAHLGLVTNGIVTAYKVVNGAKGAQLGQAATTDAQSRFQINIGNYAGPILFELTSNAATKYLDEATGTQISMPQKTVYRTILASVPTNPVAITALTEMATYGALLNGGTAQAISDAYALVKDSFASAATDLVYTIPANLASATPGTAAQENYAAILAALSVLPSVDPTSADLYDVVQTYERAMFADPGIMYPAVVDFGGGNTLASLVNAANWTALNNGLRQPAAFTPAGASAKATTTTVAATPVSVAGITYAGPQYNWTGPISGTGYQSANAVYFTTTNQPCTTSDMQHLIWAYEAALTNLLNDFGVTAAQLGISAANKLHVMCTNQIPVASGVGANAGFQVVGYSKNIAAGQEPDSYYKLVKHEMVHTFQAILSNPSASQEHRWFAEGLAVYLSGQRLIGTNAALTAWKKQPVTAPAPAIQNPISVQVFGVSPALATNPATGLPYTTSQGYYPVFGRAVEYLLTPAPVGAGNTMADVKAIYQAMSGGSTFTQAFDARMNITEANFQTNFYTIMSQFLRP